MGCCCFLCLVARWILDAVLRLFMNMSLGCACKGLRAPLRCCCSAWLAQRSSCNGWRLNVGHVRGVYLLPTRKTRTVSAIEQDFDGAALACVQLVLCASDFSERGWRNACLNPVRSQRRQRPRSRCCQVRRDTATKIVGTHTKYAALRWHLSGTSAPLCGTTPPLLRYPFWSRSGRGCSARRGCIASHAKIVARGRANTGRPASLDAGVACAGSWGYGSTRAA